MIDHEDVHPISSGLEFQSELIAKCLKNRGPVRPLRDVAAQILRHPLNFPIEFPAQPCVIDDDAVDSGPPEANQQVLSVIERAQRWRGLKPSAPHAIGPEGSAAPSTGAIVFPSGSQCSSRRSFGPNSPFGFATTTA